MKNLKYALILLSLVVLIGATSLIKIENVRGLVTALNERPTKTESDTVYYKVSEGVSATTYFYTKDQVDSILNANVEVSSLVYTKNQIDSILSAKYGNLQLTGSKLSYTALGNKYIAKTDSTENLGVELVTNGVFASSTGWVNGYSRFTITGGVCIVDTGTSTYAPFLYQDIVIENGKTYKVQISVTAYTSGNFVIGLNDKGDGVQSTIMSGTGNYTFYLTSNMDEPKQVILQSWNLAFKGSIDNISIKEVL